MKVTLELNQNQNLIDEMGEIRIELGKRIGFGDVSKSVIPKVALVSKPDKGSLLNQDILCHGAVITDMLSQDQFV